MRGCSSGFPDAGVAPARAPFLLFRALPQLWSSLNEFDGFFRSGGICQVMPRARESGQAELSLSPAITAKNMAVLRYLPAYFRCKCGYTAYKSPENLPNQVRSEAIPVPARRKSRANARSKSPASSSSRRSSSHRNSSSRIWSRLESAHAQSDSAVESLRKQDLWLAPKTSLTRRSEDLRWSPHPGATSEARLLELADIALGLRKPQAFRRRRSQVLKPQSGRE